MELPAFRLLLSYLTAASSSYSAIPKHLPRSGDTIRAWMLSSYDDNKVLLKQQLHSIPWSVHFSFDLWTSTNGLAILGIVGHWISIEGVIQHGLLAMKKIEVAHSGENQAALVMHMLTEYQLFDKVGYFTLDNASSNDSALRIIGHKLQALGVDFDHKQRRLRCFGLTINLVVKAFLYGTDANHQQVVDIEEDNGEPAVTLKELTTQLEYWRKHGAYGRSRNIITYICWTPQRREEFIQLSRESSPDTTAFLPIAHQQKDFCIYNPGMAQVDLHRYFGFRGP